jgi:hypothetical protein
LGPFTDLKGGCARFADLKVDKSRLSIALDGPKNYQDQRNTQHKKEKNMILFSQAFFTFPDFPGPVVFGWVVQKTERANKSG